MFQLLKDAREFSITLTGGPALLLALHYVTVALLFASAGITWLVKFLAKT